MTSPTQQPDLREAVARIIDAHGWATHDHQIAAIERSLVEEHKAGARESVAYYTHGSLAKADSILALLSSSERGRPDSNPGSGGES